MLAKSLYEANVLHVETLVHYHNEQDNLLMEKNA